jgi:hypothetical protein
VFNMDGKRMALLTGKAAKEPAPAEEEGAACAIDPITGRSECQ